MAQAAWEPLVGVGLPASEGEGGGRSVVSRRGVATQSPPPGTWEEASEERPPLTPERVFEEHFDFVWRSLRRLGVAPSALDDATQEVFIVVCKRLSAFEGRSQLRSWLFGIAVNVAHKARRSAQRCCAEPLPEVLPDADGVSPHEAATQAEGIRTVYGLLDRLTPPLRAVFVLAELEELSAPEIAAVLDIPLNTVYSRWRSARAAFEAALQRHHARTHEADAIVGETP